jgi:hypothetical protein
MAAAALDLHLATMREEGLETPVPSSLEAIRADLDWAEGRGIDWSKVAISIIRPGRFAGALSSQLD